MALIKGALAVFLACSAVDGDSLTCDGHHVRLEMIDSVERHEDLAKYDAARRHMQALVEGQRVTCEILGRDYFKRHLARCFTDATPDLGAEMLRSGHAIKYSKKCHGRQAECRR